MNIHALRAFVQLAHNHCDFGIHKELGIPRSTLWTLIDELEKSTGLQLVVRRKRHNTLTEAAHRLLPFAQHIVHLFETGIQEARADMVDEPYGEVLISTTQAVASTFLMPSIRTFHKRYPRVSLKILAEDAISPTTERMADILLRPIEPKEYLERKWHFTYQHALYASPAYLKQHGEPKKGPDLLNHAVIGYGESPFSYFSDIDWHLKGRWADLPRLTPSMTINSTVSIYIAASEGMGICSATSASNLFYEGKLIRVLPYIDGPILRSYFCTKKNMGAQLKQNVTIFQHFFEQYLSDLGVEVESDIPVDIAANL